MFWKKSSVVRSMLEGIEFTEKASFPVTFIAAVVTGDVQAIRAASQGECRPRNGQGELPNNQWSDCAMRSHERSTVRQLFPSHRLEKRRPVTSVRIGLPPRHHARWVAASINCIVPPLASIADVTILRISARNVAGGEVITASGSGAAES